ncbi:MAG: multiple sugar transport system substrate-binding protein [Thermomicrobiales bacterium]|nr:multiple sugar transport system substrate-binding protein [Thermomicrobiales bacterium]
MAENTEVRELWRDALTGKISRRDVMRRGLALGLSAPVLAALAQESVRGTLAQDREPVATFYNWMTDLHPTIFKIGEEQGVKIDVAPTTNFGFDRFVAEAKDKKSTWDLYGGVTPFLEMIALAESGTIEPWDEYLPAGMLDDFVPATREEGTYNGKLYVWPFLLDVIVQGWNAEIVAKAGLDPEAAPKNWDEYLANAQKVKDSGAAPYGCTFDFHDWRSLIPVTHSISTDVYTEAGLFRYTSDAAVQALEILKRMMPLTSADVLSEGSTDGGVNATPDEQAFAAQQAAYYIKYQNAHLRMAAAWPDPSQVRIAALPVQEGGVGGTVFWDTGVVLFTYGSNKQKAAEFMVALSNDDRIWQNSIVGNPDEGTIPVGQLPILQSKWKAWETAAPEWVTANPWTRSMYDGLEKAKAIAPSMLSVTQFTVARPEWIKYLSGEESDPKVALQKAQDAVAAEYKKQTTDAANPNGKEPGY